MRQLSPGFYYPGSDGYLYSGHSGSSAIIPARGNDTIRVTGLDQQLYPSLYDVDLGTTVLGSGNPGDDAVQFGLHAARAE